MLIIIDLCSYPIFAATQPGHIKAFIMVDKRDMNSSNTEDIDTDSPMSAVSYLQETCITFYQELFLLI